MTDMPERMPLAAEDAIAQVKAFRSGEPVEMYRAIRDALQEPHEYRAPLERPGDGRAAGQR